VPQPISKPSADARLRALRTVAANVVLATLWSFFVIRHVLFFLETGEPTALGVIALESLVVTLFVLRREARAISRSPVALAATALGTFAPLALVPTDADVGAQHIALVIQLAGLAAAVVSLASLRRSFGLVPSNRGIRTTGMYRLVRHPLYASYGLVWIAYLLANPSLWNGAVIAFATIGQAARIGLEERLLMRDEAYALYAGATRYRLVPGIY
jgi:protein-S-isoprenylcysteine O-methyltransferase Ste14